MLGDHAAFTAMSTVTEDMPVDRLKISNGIARLNRLEPSRGDPWLSAMRDPFRYFNSSPEVSDQTE